MSLDELISITNNAVKSLVKPDSGVALGSPYESPKCFTSDAEKDESQKKSHISPRSDQRNQRFPLNQSKSNSIKDSLEPEFDHSENITVIEIIPIDEIHMNKDHKDINTNCSQNITDGLPQHSKDSTQRDVSAAKPKLFNTSNSSKYNVQRHVHKEHVARNSSSRPSSREVDETTERQIVCEDQPEIIDVHEQIIATSSGMSQSEDDSSAAEGKVKSANLKASDDYFRQYLPGKCDSKVSVLKQGKVKSSPVGTAKSKMNDDVFISQFGLTERQRGLKQELAKRSDNKKPMKKFVHSKIVRTKTNEMEETDQESKKSEVYPATNTSSNAAITAAAAASAAVAAAQPLLKIQHELETKIGQLLSQISELQEKKRSPKSGPRHQDETGERIQWLEKQMAELNERRMEHLESLQQQQFQMQAQLFSMSRSRNRSPGSHIPYTGQAPNSLTSQAGMRADQPSRQAAGDSRYETTGRQASAVIKSQSYNPSKRGQLYYNPETISKQQSYLNEVRELQGSHLDTPAPREKIPKPAPYTFLQEPSKSLGFLEEILNHKDSPTQDTTFNVRGDYSSATLQGLDRNNSARGRRSEKSPVDKARRLVETLSDLEHETAASIWGNKTPTQKFMTLNRNLEPAPLDNYLNYPQNEGTPYPKLHHRSREGKAMELHLENLSEAKAMLKQLEVTRETLESNIQQVMRSRRGLNVFSAHGSASMESQVEEQRNIELMVNRKITSLQEDIQREVLRGLAQHETEDTAIQAEVTRQKTVPRKSSAKQESSRGKAQAEYMTRLATSRPNVAVSASLAKRGKENRSSKVKPPPRVSTIKDEKTLVRTYGKPEYQRGRTTIRDPYLHFKNEKTGRAARPTPLNESFVSGDGRSRSPPRRMLEDLTESPAPRQFYFSPTRGYIPLSAGDTAPIPGQMISMAIPLGRPRMEPGVRRSEVLMTGGGAANPVTSTPVPVTAARNVTLVSFPVEDDKVKKGREPELAKQVLPPIDIDSISPSSSQRSDIHMRSPQHDNVNLTFLHDTQAERSELDLDKTLVEEDSMLEQVGEGLQLPGYEPKVSDYYGPDFPPRVSKPGPGWAAGDGRGQSGGLASDVMAEDMRRRDALESNAICWLEQELMARVLSQVMPNLPQPDTYDDKSDVSDREDSLLVTDMIGQDGMQLFIDAGQPVDNALVQALIKEVLQEKVNAMLAHRSVDLQTQAGEAKVDDEDVAEERPAGPQRVPTPQPTPPPSPITSTTHHVKVADFTTPPQSPPPAGHMFKLAEAVSQPVRLERSPPRPAPRADLESETEVSVSIDISEELRRIGGKNVPQEPDEPIVVRRDVATPPLSPPPPVQAEAQAPPHRVGTPPTSPRKLDTPPTMRDHQAVVQTEKSVEQNEDEETEEEIDEDILQDQPNPIMMSVAVGKDGPMTLDMPDSVKSPSPLPRPLEPPGSPDLSSLSSDSSLTETVNEVFSDGQWLLSEGQVIGVPINKDKCKELIHKTHQYVGDVSTASTLRDTEDLTADETDFPNSEGQILISGLPAPEDDSMLELLAEMQRNPFEAYRDLPVFHVRQILSGPQPREVMSNTGRSLGEISVGQVPPSKLAVEMRNGAKGNAGRQSPSDRQSYQQSVEKETRREQRQTDNRTPSPSIGSSSRSPSPRQKARSTLPNQRTSRSPSPQKRMQMEPRGRPRAQMQYQPVLSDGAPLPSRGRTQPTYGRRSSDSWLSQNSERGMRGSRSSYLTESVSRSADSTAFRGNGEGPILTSSLKSRNSAGVKKSVEFDLSGTFERSRESPGPAANQSNSFEQTYSFEDSLDEAELKNLVQSKEYRSGPYRMSVTIPSSADAADSDLSEIDLTNNS